MAARAGMVALVGRLRRLTAADVADWPDEELQEALDRQRTERRGVPIEPIDERRPAQTTFTDYLIPLGLRELEYDASAQDEDGFALLDSRGQAAPAHTVQVEAGLIVFAADTGGLTYYLDARVYDVNAAAADVWEQKAAAVAAAVDWRSDNHQISASQEQAHCLKMAREFRAKAGGGMQSVELYRSDEAWQF